jgi:hypothetical protein
MMTPEQERDLAAGYGFRSRLDHARGSTWSRFIKGPTNVWLTGRGWARGTLDGGWFLSITYHATLEEALQIS